jgi:hypothetical protein
MRGAQAPIGAYERPEYVSLKRRLSSGCLEVRPSDLVVDADETLAEHFGKLSSMGVPQPLNDGEVRARLLQYLAKRGFSPVEEVALAWNRTRIDVVGMHGGVLCGFEIKSEADTLERLKKQAQRYRRYFEKLYLVGAEGHLEGARLVLPGYWGIWAVRAHGRGVHIIRRTPPAQSPRSNRHQKAQPLAMLMRKPELLNVLGTIEPELHVEHLTRTELSKLCAERLGIREIEHHLFEALHARQSAGPV